MISGQPAASVAALPVPLCVSVLVRACPLFQWLRQHQTFRDWVLAAWLDQMGLPFVASSLANLFLPWPPFGITVSV